MDVNSGNMSTSQQSSQPSDIFSTLDLNKVKAELESNGKTDCPTANCKETFKSLWGLKFHLKRNSCNSPKFKCDKCDSAFQSRIVLQQHVCGTSTKSTKASSVIKEGDKGVSFIKQDGLTPCAVKEDTEEIIAPTIEKTESTRNISSDQEMLSPKRKRERPLKLNTSTPVAAAMTTELGEDCSIQLKDGKPTQEDNSRDVCIKPKDTKTLVRKGSVSHEQDILTPKRKRGRQPKANNSTPVAAATATELGEDCLMQSEDGKPTQKDNSGDVCIKSKDTKTLEHKHKQEILTTKRKRGMPLKIQGKEKESGDSTDVEDLSIKPMDIEFVDQSNIVSSSINNGTSKSIGVPSTVIDLTSPKRGRESVNASATTCKENKPNETIDLDKYCLLKASDMESVNIDKECIVITTTVSTSQDSPSPKKKRGRPLNTVKPVKKRGRPCKARTDNPNKKVKAIRSNIRSASRKEENQDGVPVDDGACDTSPSAKKAKLKDGDDNTKTPRAKKTKERPDKEILIASLKKQLRTGKISCTNKCGKKFASLNGFHMHFEVCGKERKTIECEKCGKAYTTQAGLRYHMNTMHVHTEPENKEQNDGEEKEEETEVQDSTLPTDGPKRPRKAAARANKKFHEIQEEQKKVEKTKDSIANKNRSLILDPHINKFRENLITPALMVTVKDELRKHKIAVCPNKDCEKTFKIYNTFNNHYLQCGFDTHAFECMECGQGYNSLDGARIHVEKVHEVVPIKCTGDDASLKDSESSGSEREESDDDNDGDEDYAKDTDEESNTEEDEGEDIINDDDDYDDNDDNDDDDDNDEKTKPLSGDKGNKKYRVKMGDRGKKGSNTMLYVGRWNKTFREFEKWRKNNFSETKFFPQHIPTLDHWSRVKDSEVSQYTPTSTQSPHFRIVRPNIPQHKNTLDTQLPVFTGLPIEDSGIHGDRIFYTGGPVWELSWCPVPDRKRDANQYLVASAHKSFDTVFNAYENHKTKGLLQVWNLGTLSNTSSSSGKSPSLDLSIAHDFGPVWKVSWCPNGVWQSPRSANKDKKLSRLGLMALACGDGIVRIISVPHPDQLLSKLEDSFNGATNESEQIGTVNKVMVNCIPDIELYPCSLKGTYSARRGQAMCVEWSPLEPFNKVAAGFTDGTVAVWNLLTESALLKKSTGPLTSRLAPYIFIKAHSSLIKDLAFCPVNVDYIVTGGHDRCYKIWDLTSSISPVFVAKKGLPYEVKWPFYTNGFIYCEDVIYSKDDPSVRFCNISGSTFRPLFQFPSSVFTFSYNSWINVLASADVAGDVMFGKMISSRKQKWYLYKAMLEDLEPSDETTDSTDNGRSRGRQIHVDLKEKGRSLNDAVSSSRIVFEDRNILQFRFLISNKNKEIEEKAKPFQYNCSTLQAVHKIRWNPNKQALTWIASGGASGLVRIHQVREVEPNHLKSAS